MPLGHRWFWSWTKGNPFFAEELLRSWLEQGALACEDERWRLSASQPPSEYNVLPVSILSAIRQRLTRLATETVDALRVAAIVGGTFELSLLAQVRDEEVEVVEERLLEGVGARLVRPEGTASYAFTHDKIRECLYAEVSGARRRRLHEVIGRALEERYRQAASENRLTHILADLAFHFARSGDLERGITYSVKVAEQAQQSYAFEEALIQYQTALDLLDPTDRRRGDLLLRLGEVMLSAGREGEAAAIFDTAHGLLIQSQPEGHRSVAATQAAHGLGMARWHQGALREAQIAFRRSPA